MDITLGQLAQWLEVTLPAELEAEQPVKGICTDSRQLQAGDVFIALKGDNFDGADFARSALAQGALLAVVAAPQATLGLRQLVVTDTLTALGQIAHHWRQQLTACIIAITGSAGKTTTKNMVAAICQQAGPTVAAEGTHNNEIGVPQTLLRLGRDDAYGVLEFGMRGRGEIRQLAEIVRPQVGVITGIGEAHIGRLGSREAIAETKAEILPLLPPEGTAVLPAEDFFFPLLAGMCPCPVLAFGFGDAAQVRCEAVLHESLTGQRARVRLGETISEITLQLPGRHNLSNALAAAAAALAAGCSPEQIVAGLAACEATPMRGELLPGPQGSMIINDAYNANPVSVAAALQVLQQSPGRRLMVLGDMLELGPTAAEAHQQLGRLIAQAGVVWLITVGELAALAGESAAAAGLQVTAATSPEEAAELLRPELRPGDAVLVKGSRGMQLERTVGRLQDAS
jgi:UDP-N-acetylmuramoyl-tripeptide--D-alanyl-D-alanine ligase